MALYGNVLASDEDDDLETLRLAALQTLGSKPSSNNTKNINTVDHPVVYPPGPGKGFGHMYSGRNQVFQRHRQNSNLIAIVPVNSEPSPGSNSSQKVKVGGRGQNDNGIRLELPQDRYCKVESSKDDKTDVPLVSTKFSRYDDSDSESSAEESDREDSSNKESASENEEEDRVVLTVEEDSLDKLMNELEEEMNKSETNVPVSKSVKPEPQKRTKLKHNTCDSKRKKSQGGISSSKEVPIPLDSGNRKPKDSSDLSPTSYSLNHHNVLSDKNKNSKTSVPLSHKTQRQFSPNLKRRSRSNSRGRTRSRSRSQHSDLPPSKKIRRSRSPSPRVRYNYSPIRSPRGRLSRSPIPRNRLSRSPLPRGRLSRSPPPRSRLSRSPVRLARSRSRSPKRPLRPSPRKRYSRSPSSHLSRFSPQRSSPRSRRPRSPSPRVSRCSPQRSPQSRWWPSPRRSPSPRLRRTPSPRSRRISVSPRRPLSPIRRRLSPSPVRRNPSPIRRFSPRRNLSPVRYARSISRSPGRFISRARSPLSPKRRSPRSLSPRRRSSHSPFSRVPPRHSPVSRKLSPWSPPKQRISPIPRRYSNSPGDRRRSQSPYERQKRSTSPVRRPSVNRLPPRVQRSPPRDSHRHPQESRINNVRPRSQSPLSSRQHLDSNIRQSRSPRPARSTLRRSRSPTSSISLSPSPDRDTVNNPHRYKSPLRLYTSDYRTTAPHLHTSKENSNRQRNISPGQPVREDLVSSLKLSKTKSAKRKEPGNKNQRRERIKEDVKKDSDRKSKENTSVERTGAEESSPQERDNQTDENTINDPMLAILEARKRKFESKGPVKPEAKKIRLKAAQPSQPTLPQTEERQEVEPEIQPIIQQLDDMLEEVHGNSGGVTETETVDNIDFDGDETVLDLDGNDLWASEESTSDNEGRFKSSTRIERSGGNAKVTVLPFTKLLGEPNTSARVDSTGAKPKKSDMTEKVAKPRKVSSKNNEALKTDNEGKKTKQLPDENQEKVKIESKISNPNAPTNEIESKVEYSEKGNDMEQELPVISREGDLRAELSRRRAERLTKAGSLHETLPARLLQNAFEGVMGKKNIKRTETEEKKSSTKQTEVRKEKTDGRRVLLLKRSAVAEERIPSFSVTIRKDDKHDLKADSPPGKLPIRMRLGFPSGGSPPDEHLVSRRRSRKVKLKRNVMLGSRNDDKV